MNKHWTQSKTGKRIMTESMKPSRLDLQNQTMGPFAIRSGGHKHVEFFRVILYEERARQRRMPCTILLIMMKKTKRVTQNLASFPVIRIGGPIGATSTSDISS